MNIKPKKDTVKITGISLFTGCLILAGTGFAVWYYMKKRKGKKANFEVSSAGRTSYGGGFSCMSRSYPLAYGTCHPDVKILQRYLISQHEDLGNGGADGKFGKLTEKAAKKALGKTSFSKSDVSKLKG